MVSERMWHWGMKHKLAVINEVLTRQAAAFNELQAATRCVQFNFQLNLILCWWKRVLMADGFCFWTCGISDAGMKLTLHVWSVLLSRALQQRHLLQAIYGFQGKHWAYNVS
jgi:hypothetical protein